MKKLTGTKFPNGKCKYHVLDRKGCIFNKKKNVLALARKAVVPGLLEHMSVLQRCIYGITSMICTFTSALVNVAYVYFYCWFFLLCAVCGLMSWGVAQESLTESVPHERILSSSVCCDVNSVRKVGASALQSWQVSLTTQMKTLLELVITGTVHRFSRLGALVKNVRDLTGWNYLDPIKREKNTLGKK